VIGRFAGTTSSTGLPAVRTTTGCASSGSHLPTAPSSAIRPSSTSIITAAAVMGLVIEAMRKIESGAMEAPPRLAEPTAATSLRSPRATKPTAPGTAALPTYVSRTLRRSVTDPPFCHTVSHGRPPDDENSSFRPGHGRRSGCDSWAGEALIALLLETAVLLRHAASQFPDNQPDPSVPHACAGLILDRPHLLEHRLRQ
jgi:hypothetical protein